MKARVKLSVIFAIATVAVLAASQSVNQAGAGERFQMKEQEVVRSVRNYREEDVDFLMQANHWSRQDAIEVLEKAAESAAKPEANKESD